VRYTPSPDCFFRGDDPLAIAGAVPGLLQLDLASREPWGDPQLFDPFRCNLVLTLFSDAPRREIEAALRLVSDQVEIADLTVTRPEDADASRTTQTAAERTVRIDAARLDALAELVDELMVAKNAAAHLAARAEAGLDVQALRRGLAAHAAEFDRVAGRLHRTVMRARMAPLTGLWRRFPRLVREIAAAQDKAVDFQLTGESIEVDKRLLDGLFEPLIHLVRNALDHGIEPAAERKPAGKPARATLSLSARQAGDLVVIDVADDGRGIDPDAVRRTALARGLMDADQLAALSDQDAIELIFLSGFSTAQNVSDLSGRGVGMDAVRSSVHRLGGDLTVASAPGKGTRVSLSLPLAMLLTKVMVVSAGGERFGVPMDAISETAKIEAARIAGVREGRAFVLRDRTVPLFDLAGLTGLPHAHETDTDLTVLVVRHGEGLAAVSVDRVVDRIDVVMRPLSGLLSHMPGVSGATLMGDGDILMLLDLEEMIG
jgi:two-component system, chemotaxis family, sensor kinase CheA